MFSPNFRNTSRWWPKFSITGIASYYKQNLLKWTDSIGCIGVVLGVGLILFPIVILAIVILFAIVIPFAIVTIIDGIVVVPIYTVLTVYTGLEFLAVNLFIALDKLFYLGFEAPVVAVWAFWGLVGGIAIQGYREMKIYGRKGLQVLVALAPIFLLGFAGIVKTVDVPKPPSMKATTVEQNTPESEVPEPIGPLVPSGMVLIPAGEFQMGSGDNTDEKPVHTVYIDAFYIDKYEVTNAHYKTFVDANPQWRKDRIPTEYHDGDYLKHWSGNNYPPEKGEHPVTYVSWYAAMAYARWVDKRLPTEAEWEKAARGGSVDKKYPWGDFIHPIIANYNKNVGDTTFAGKYSPNAYGLYDMAGNVLEWCLDVYYEGFHGSSPRQNPLAGRDILNITTNFSQVKTNRVLRGSSWKTLPQFMRVDNRTKGNPTFSYSDVGFRCVKAAPSKTNNTRNRYQ